MLNIFRSVINIKTYNSFEYSLGVLNDKQGRKIHFCYADIRLGVWFIKGGLATDEHDFCLCTYTKRFWNWGIVTKIARIIIYL